MVYSSASLIHLLQALFVGEYFVLFSWILLELDHGLKFKCSPCVPVLYNPLMNCIND